MASCDSHTSKASGLTSKRHLFSLPGCHHQFELQLLVHCDATGEPLSPLLASASESLKECQTKEIKSLDGHFSWAVADASTGSTCFVSKAVVLFRSATDFHAILESADLRKAEHRRVIALAKATAESDGGTIFYVFVCATEDKTWATNYDSPMFMTTLVWETCDVSLEQQNDVASAIGFLEQHTRYLKRALGDANSTIDPRTLIRNLPEAVESAIFFIQFLLSIPGISSPVARLVQGEYGAIRRLRADLRREPCTLLLFRRLGISERDSSAICGYLLCEDPDATMTSDGVWQ